MNIRIVGLLRRPAINRCNQFESHMKRCSASVRYSSNFFDKLKSSFSFDKTESSKLGRDSIIEKAAPDDVRRRNITDKLLDEVAPKGIFGFFVKKAVKFALGKVEEEVKILNSSIEKIVEIGSRDLNENKEARRVLGRNIEIIEAECVGAITKANRGGVDRIFKLHISHVHGSLGACTGELIAREVNDGKDVIIEKLELFTNGQTVEIQTLNRSHGTIIDVKAKDS